jgi:hypothetical protein
VEKKIDDLSHCEKEPELFSKTSIFVVLEKTCLLSLHPFQRIISKISGVMDTAPHVAPVKTFHE